MAGIKEVSLSYYSRKDIQKAIFDFCENRETVPSYMMESFGKRPDMLHYPSDILNSAKQGATSFHCSEELWINPLNISRDMNETQLNNLKKGWDLLIDIDSKYLDYSKILAELLIQALEFHNVKNIGIKFSGSKGFHIIVPWKAFPEEFNNIKTKDMFPEWPRIISQYLYELVKPQLVKQISNLIHSKTYIKDPEEAEKVIPDIVLVSSRHLFRCPYSLHEKTALSSVVLMKDEIQNFKPQDASPLKVNIREYSPQPEKDEAKELLIQALDWFREQENKKQTKKKFTGESINIKNLTIREDMFPDCIKTILKGIKSDGRKRALFILLSFFSSLEFPQEYIEEKINEWNKKNYHPLRQGYIKSQLTWFARNKMLPPNCDKPLYKELGINCSCGVKNPINYTIKQAMKLNSNKR